MQFDQVHRRAFIALLGGAAAWPLAARAQEPGKIARVGILSSARAAPTTIPAMQAFFGALRALGFREGANLNADIKWADEDAREPSLLAGAGAIENRRSFYGRAGSLATGPRRGRPRRPDRHAGDQL